MEDVKFLTMNSIQNNKEITNGQVGNWHHIKIEGNGWSKEEASLNFIEQMLIMFPSEKGVYKTGIRQPLVHEIRSDFNTGKDSHHFFIRISFKAEENE